MSKIGIIVGSGKLPLYFLEEAESREIEAYPLGLVDDVDEKIKTHKNYKKFNIGEIGSIVKYLILNDIKEVVMLGKIEKNTLFKKMNLDFYGEELLKRLPDRKDETLLFGVISFLRLNKIKVLPQNHLLKNFMFEEKSYTNRKPSLDDEKTIKI
ncbi:MAG: DUF1009 domain-containing protein, partial [Cetobacterium sp.]